MRVEHLARSSQGWTARWRMSSEGPDGAREWTLDRRCDARGAEEPWVGLNSAGVLELGEQTWRVPPSLALGDTYEGTLRASVAGLEVPLTRSHRVTGREPVTTEAGTFDAARVRVEERTSHAAAATVIEQWIAPGPGLVRMIQSSGGAEILYELVDWQRADAAR
jgi:hypothetical protein